MCKIFFSWSWNDQVWVFWEMQFFVNAKIRWYCVNFWWPSKWMKFWWYSDFFSHFTQSTALLSQWRKAHWRKDQSANVFTLDVFTGEKRKVQMYSFAPYHSFGSSRQNIPSFIFFENFFGDHHCNDLTGKSLPLSLIHLKNLTKLFCPVCFVLSWNGFVYLVCFVLYFLKWVRCKTQFAAHFGWDPVLDFLQNAIKIHLIAAG